MAKSAGADRSSRMQPLWARVDANRTKLAAFVFLFVVGSALLLAAGARRRARSADRHGAGHSGIGATGPDTRSPLPEPSPLLLVLGSLLSAVQLANAEDWVRNRFSGRALGGGRGARTRVGTDGHGARGRPARLRRACSYSPSRARTRSRLGTARKRAVVGVTEGMLRALHRRTNCGRSWRRSSHASWPETSCSGPRSLRSWGRCKAIREFSQGRRRGRDRMRGRGLLESGMRRSRVRERGRVLRRRRPRPTSTATRRADASRRSASRCSSHS